MITITNEDNMKLMERYPNNYFDLAIVDPPYGIGVSDWDIKKPSRPNHSNNIDLGYVKYNNKGWDLEKPRKEYWESLFRVSNNVIVWGGNYFTEYLPSSKGWIFWNKLFDKTFNFSHGELAYTSFDKQLLMFTMSSKAETNGGKDRIHPTQKPVSLYKWILEKYAKAGDKILDTHLGSGSIAIACHDYKFDLTACELDADYYNAAMNRINNHTKQQKLF